MFFFFVKLCNRIFQQAGPFSDIITLGPLEKREYKQLVSLSHLINQGLNYLNLVPFNEESLDIVSGILLHIISNYMHSHTK